MRTRAFIVAVLAATLTLAACGSAEQQPKSEQGQHNQADIRFAQGMIPHHEQAVRMADMVPPRTRTPELRSLAERIKQAQQPEIDTMTGWLRSWGAKPSGEHGGGHGKHRMTGMMSDQDMAKLEAAKGPAFDKSWLNMMIAHHEGAVTMSKTELDQGSSQRAKQLARGIIKAQRGEIQHMREMLG